MSDLRDKARFKEALEQLAKIFATDQNAGSPAYIGAGYINPQERATRRHAIDVMLTGLGWTLDQYGQDTLEEIQAKGETTLFLDYLGVDPRSRAPLLIVEAKAWAKPFVFPSASMVDDSGPDNTMDAAASLLARAVDHVKSGGEVDSSPVTQEWAKWIAKLRDYVHNVYQTSGHCAQRVVITSGQWLVIVCNPMAAFLDEGNAADSGILCFFRKGLIEHSDEIHKWLAWKTLIRYPPERLRPAQLRSYITASDVTNIFHALWVVHRVDGAHFDIHPQLKLYPALIIRRRDGLLITVVDENQRFAVPYEPNNLSQHIGDVAGSVDTLLQAVNAELDSSIIPTDIKEFPGFHGSLEQSPPLDVRPSAPQTKIELLKPWPRHANEFLLATGAHPHFLHLQPTVSNCRFHDWSACHATNEHQGSNPVAVRSVNPRSFFRSTEDHHCAHRQVHDRRQTRCQIDAFEEFLCCRACTLQTFCWTLADIARLPCGSPARTPRAETLETADKPPADPARRSY